MATTPAVGSGPVEFMDESTGQQLSIPLSDLSFDANGNIVPDGWPLYQQHKATVDSLLAYLKISGAIYPAPQPPPTPAMVIEAKHEGSSGNNIQVAFSKVGITDPNDSTKFDAQVTEAERYTSLTKDTIEGLIGTDLKPGSLPKGLIMVTDGSAKGRPTNKSYSMPAVAPFKVSVKDDQNKQAFEVQARDGSEGAQYISVIVSGVSATDPNDQRFNLVVTWQKAAAAIKSSDLSAQFGYEITVSAPQGAVSPGVPANGIVTLRGGADAAAATKAKATVVGSS